jgi:transposase
MKLYAAIDLHSTNYDTVVIDEQDRVIYQKRLPNDLALILKELSVHQSELQGIVVESTYNWYWRVDDLMEQDYKLHLANTAAIQQYEGPIRSIPTVTRYSGPTGNRRWRSS